MHVHQFSTAIFGTGRISVFNLLINSQNACALFQCSNLWYRKNLLILYAILKSMRYLFQTCCLCFLPYLDLHPFSLSYPLIYIVSFLYRDIFCPNMALSICSLFPFSIAVYKKSPLIINILEMNLAMLFIYKSIILPLSMYMDILISSI